MPLACPVECRASCYKEASHKHFSFPRSEATALPSLRNGEKKDFAADLCSYERKDPLGKPGKPVALMGMIFRAES
jgi:hypothetical protein